jgi:regulatory protein
MDEKEKKVLERLQRQCSRMECAPSDILRKALSALENDGEAARRVVASLEEDGYLDEKRYAAALAREKSSLSGWGPYKIRQALSAKGISREAADAALSEIDGEKAAVKLAAVAAAKYKLLKGDPQCRLKLLKFLLSRGYDYPDAAAAAESAMDGSVDQQELIPGS